MGIGLEWYLKQRYNAGFKAGYEEGVRLGMEEGRRVGLEEGRRFGHGALRNKQSNEKPDTKVDSNGSE